MDRPDVSSALPQKPNSFWCENGFSPAVWAEPAFARSYLNCLTKKLVIVDAPKGITSSSIEENVGFWIDEAAKTLVFADGTPLTVRRFDDRWISATRGNVSYELD